MINYKQILEAVNRGIKLALDDFDDEVQDQEPILSKKKIQDYDAKDDFDRFYYPVVDLGLPSGTIWAKYNIGADPSNLYFNGSWSGDYFAWGEVKPKDVYDYDSYKYHGDVNAKRMKDYYTTYVWPDDNNKKLRLQDDAAYINSNGVFVMPTAEQFQELKENCYSPEFGQYGYYPIRGYKFISKINGNEIFFPMTEFKSDDDVFIQNEKMNYKCIAFYWTSSMINFGESLDDAQSEYFRLSYSGNNKFICVLTAPREVGMCIRGVLPNKNKSD